ncbi:MAG TPA: DUF2214 family protein [Polyangiales bacterium]|jgi:putative membrane protein|nr:DUF2214 family protein [Polyangiales bacterium]
MIARSVLASLHLLALGIGLGAVWTRARGLRGTLDESGLRRVFGADTLWGLAALIWIATGLTRAFGGFEKGSAYYLSNTLFWIKMTLLVSILLLEIGPMVALIQWRIRSKRGRPLDLRAAPRFAAISHLQALFVIAMVFVASAMARGFG